MLREEIRRREASEEALRQAQKMEAVGRLTGGIAHDFNNLLTAILGNLDLALRRIEGQDRIRGWLSNCRQASERAATLVQRLLAFSRQHPLEVRSVDINRLVQGMSELLARSIGETVDDRDCARRWIMERRDRPEPARERDRQSRRQCARRDAGRRTAHHRDGELASRRALRGDIGGRRRARTIRHGGGERLRQRHDARGEKPRVRAVLHHQAERRRHRPRAQPGLWLRQAVRRAYPHLQRGRRGLDHQAVFPAPHRPDDIRPGPRRKPCRPRQPMAARPCWWSRTTRR